MAVVKISKRYKEWGRRLRGSKKARRSGPSGKKCKRKVKWETPKMRCECHHAWPCKR